MKFILKQLTITACALLYLSLPVFAGQLDEHYLAAFGVQTLVPTDNALQKAVLLPSPEISEIPHCGTPLKHGLQRDWNKLEPATQKTLAKQLAAPVLSGTTSGTEPTLVSPSGRFRIHYTISGVDAVPSISWVQTVAQTFDAVAVSFTGLGWNLAPTAAGAPYDVYLRDLAALRLYGQTTTNQAVASTGFSNAYASSIDIDNDFAEDIYTKASLNNGIPVFTPLQSLQITTAHEYHHAIQFGYNVFFDIWYAEATSSWFEDELYDNVNQLYSYLSASMRNTNLSLDIPTDTITGGGYGRWLLNRHFSESHGGPSIIRSFWESLATKAPNGGNDIPMSPIIDAILQTTGSSLGNDLFGYASRLYTGAWTTHQAEIGFIPAVSVSATSGTYPITVASVPTPSITLPHYSFAFFQLKPTTGAPATLNITLTRDIGISAVAFRKTNNTITPFNPNSGTNLIVIPGFDTASEVVLLVANATSNDNQFAGFSSDGSPIQYALPGTTIISATPSATPPSITLTWTAVAGATSYQIYRSATSSTSLTLLDTTSATAYTDTNVVINHTFYYSITPVKAAGLTGPASQVSFAKVIATAPVVAEGAGGGGGGGGCFIATAAYGSYLHPQVQILRDFRDTWLLTNAPGRAFVDFYYRLSPPVAGFIAQHETLRLLVRLLLVPVIFVISNFLATILFSITVISGILFRRFRLNMIQSSVPQ